MRRSCWRGRSRTLRVLDKHLSWTTTCRTHPNGLLHRSAAGLLLQIPPPCCVVHSLFWCPFLLCHLPSDCLRKPAHPAPRNTSGPETKSLQLITGWPDSPSLKTERQRLFLPIDKSPLLKITIQTLCREKEGNKDLEGKIRGGGNERIKEERKRK